MSLTLSQVEHIAHLARLALTEDETQQYCAQLSAILEHFTRLQAVDTSSLPPAASGSPAGSNLRSDEPRPGLERDILLRTAPDVVHDQFRVPPVLEEQ